MKDRSTRATCTAAIVISAIVVFIQTPAFGQDIIERFPAEMEMQQDHLNNGGGSKGLEGSWTVQVTIRNCQTGGAIRTIPRMITFARGGTLQEFAVAGSPAMPVNRGPGHGSWTHSFERNFSYSLQFFRLNADTSYGGYVRESRAIEMNSTGDEFIATGTGAVYNADGTLAFPTCATESGVRFE